MKTCLIVDDSKVARTVARLMLEMMGFHVEEAADGAEALAHCDKVMPDMVLLDNNMPVMDGMAFLSALRATKAGQKPRVIFCTGEHAASFTKAAVKAGADAYMCKPFDRAALAAALQDVSLR